MSVEACHGAFCTSYKHFSVTLICSATRTHVHFKAQNSVPFYSGSAKSRKADVDYTMVT